MAFRPMIFRGFSTSSAALSIKNVTVIGGGLMGSGIAQVSVVSTVAYISSYYYMIRE